VSGYHIDRTLMVEQDPEKVEASTEPLVSIKQADWRHQAKAMAAGYNSLVEYAVDELVAEVRDLKVRMETLDEQILELRRARD
jgi:vacuolar-type H+-ATPase subunit I/STV1